jgi:hypothetical protein
MEVVQTEDAKRAFIVCQDPDQQDHMGRITVPLPRLQQWQTSAKQVASVIAGLLGVEDKPVFQQGSASYKLAMLKGKKVKRDVAG